MRWIFPLFLKSDRTAKSLWDQAKRGMALKKKASTEIEPNLLAAYLEGRASAEEVERIEQAMFENAELLRTIQDLREILSPPILLSIPEAFPWRMVVAAAAAAILVMMAGFYAGQRARRMFQAEPPPSSFSHRPAIEEDPLFFDLLTVAPRCPLDQDVQTIGKEGDLR